MSKFSNSTRVVHVSDSDQISSFSNLNRLIHQECSFVKIASILATVERVHRSVIFDMQIHQFANFNRRNQAKIIIFNLAR